MTISNSHSWITSYLPPDLKAQGFRPAHHDEHGEFRRGFQFPYWVTRAPLSESPAAHDAAEKAGITVEQLQKLLLEVPF